MSSPSQNNPWIDRLVGEGDRYRISKCLSVGGMGEVYLAIDTKLNKPVALKLLKESLAKSTEMYQRFQREVELCRALNSEHIVKILDFGTTPEDFPFYVMEYLEGESLGRLLQRQKRLNVKRTAEIMRQVCAGLQLAHAGVVLKGERVKIVHRDLKPDNIFLVPTALGGLVKILDFGIAKKIRETLSQSKYTVFTDIFLGTFRYAAPEQIVISQEIDGRADIYSWGIIFYRMLSGTDPFGLGSETQQIGEATWAKAHTSRSPQPLRSQPGGEQISPQLEALVLKCLQKSPEDRFATIADLKQALSAAIASSPSVTSTSSSTTIVQSPSPAISDSPTVPRQAIPLAKPEVDDSNTIAQIAAESASTPQISDSSDRDSDRTIYQSDALTAPSSPDSTIYQGDASPEQNRSHETIYQGDASSRQNQSNETIYQGDTSPEQNQPNQNQTLYQGVASPGQNQPDRTIYQSVNSPRQNQPDRTIYQGVNSSRQNDVNRTIYQRQPLLLRFWRISQQIRRATLRTTFSLYRIIRRLIRKIEAWIRSSRSRS
ncbi:MAG: Serine/threonine-protein kinase PknD [Chroococcidiopsis sp. SAG 2025]|uniref:serine/threonine protein kinase n=1 Tax=Chroococcidiopsis sp. SAG 2025 TaxID=171389 RepID=UPI00293725DD|nr:serine/threonine-protein kinase [Chroococcidiopsis sp. SAG 2025]MDV2997178.1 Serine/threonine-protein kinase PknD [Chroococcidiopsis sp. SAG 2025]